MRRPWPQGECDPSYGADFVFDIHAKELIVGEIFVRIFNEQPSYPLEVGPLEGWFITIVPNHWSLFENMIAQLVVLSVKMLVFHFDFVNIAELYYHTNELKLNER